MLHLHFSNRQEVLAALLAEQIATTPRGVFEAVPVLVASTAQQRALTLAVADRTGLCANLRFDFPARWLWSQIGRVVPSVGATSPLDAGHLVWRVSAAFADPSFFEPYPRLRSYLLGADPVMRYELAVRVAVLLEHYGTYREDWLETWGRGAEVEALMVDGGNGEHAAWQSALWRRVAATLGVEARHPARAFASALSRPDIARAAGLPAAVHVFGVQSLPPLHIRLLHALGEVMDVQLYLANPCREYWFEITGRRRLAHLRARGFDAGHEEGNRLLASWGRQTQSLIDQVIEGLGDRAEDDATFVPSGRETLLGRLQDAILDLTELPPISADPASADRSIEVHVCHSLTRQLEVLQDRLLGLFDANVPGGDAPLRPSDVLVVLPDLDVAAPLIEAVFGNAPRERKVPFSITGRRPSTVGGPANALLELLTLLESRCGASDLHAVLCQPIIARRMGLDEDALGRVREWLASAGIRWGLDGPHRAGFDVPASERHTVERGIDRLFLGFALPDGMATPLFGELLPAGAAGDGGGEILGGFWRFVDQLRALRDATAVPLHAARWADVLQAATATFFAPTDAEREPLRALLATIGDLTVAVGAADPDQPVPLAVIRRALTDALDAPARGGQASGRLTFSSMSSLRGLPFRVVCILGLEDGVFPGTDRPDEFDLIARHPHRGDLQRRDDQRNLFLDLILAARECLHLSYTGRGIRDGKELPPSVLVAELLDVLIPALAADPLSPTDLAAARHRLIVEHPLQAFSTKAFSTDGDPRGRSYNRELADAVRHGAEMVARGPGPVLSGGTDEDDETDGDEQVVDPAAPLFQAALPPASEDWFTPTLADLVAFYENPSRTLLTKRLGLDLPRGEREIEDVEPLQGSRSMARALAARLLAPALQGIGGPALQALARAGIERPDGSLGESVVDAELQNLRVFAARVRAATASPVLAPHHGVVEFDIEGERWALAGTFADLRADGLVRHVYDESGPARLIGAWLHHLFLCARPADGVANRTRWLFRDRDVCFRAPDDPIAELRVLVALYRQGLTRPIRFFPKTSWKQQQGESPSKVRGSWKASDYNRYAESADPHHALALRGLPDPLDDEFRELAERVFGPLAAHLDGGP